MSPQPKFFRVVTYTVVHPRPRGLFSVGLSTLRVCPVIVGRRRVSSSKVGWRTRKRNDEVEVHGKFLHGSGSLYSLTLPFTCHSLWTEDQSPDGVLVRLNLLRKSFPRMNPPTVYDQVRCRHDLNGPLENVLCLVGDPRWGPLRFDE